MEIIRNIASPVALVCAAVAPCHATDYLTIPQAQEACFPAAQFQVAHVVFTDDQRKAIEQQSGIPVTTRAQKIWRVFNANQQQIGWFVVDYVVGKHLLIDYAVAIDMQQKVSDVEILSYRESYGGEIRSRDWLKQFKGKSSGSPLTLNHDITNIGGATLSSRHVTEGIKRILATIHVTQS